MWAHIINAIVGIWLMAAPAVLGYGDPAETNSHIFGPVITTFAVIAWWEATRAVGRWNVPLGLWLVAAPWVLGYDGAWVIANSMAAGAIVAALGLVKGTITQRFGGGWRALWQDHPEHEREARASYD